MPTLPGVLDRRIRGIRENIPPGYVLGRVSSGHGPAELIPIAGFPAIVAVGGVGSSSGVNKRIVYTLPDIESLRALVSPVPVAYLVRGYYAPGDGGGGEFVYDPDDEDSDDNGGTIIVDSSSVPRRWKRVYDDEISLRWFGAVGDGVEDDTDAVVAAFATGLPIHATKGTYSVTDGPTITDGMSVRGDGPGKTIFSCATADKPAMYLGEFLYNFTLSDLALTHSVTATAGGDGLAQGLNGKHWVDHGTISNIRAYANFNGANMGVAFYCRVTNCDFAYNALHGWIARSNGTTELVNGDPGPGQMQWYMDRCGSAANTGDGYHFESLASGANFSQSLSMGTMTDCYTYANGGWGVKAVGTAAGPIYGIRIDGGFYGEDGEDEILLDTWGNNHVIRPTFVELAGKCGVKLTANGNGVNFKNSGSVIQISRVNGCGREGVFSEAPGTNIVGGTYTNNGVSLTSGRQNAIQFYSVAGQVTGVIASDTGQNCQLYGIASNSDGHLIASCDLRNFASGGGPTALPTLTGSQITGCYPVEINYSQFGDVTTATLHSAATNFTGPVTLNTGVQMSPAAGATGTGITVHNIKAITSAAVGQNASGTAGQLDVAGPFHANAASAFFGAITLAANGVQMSPGAGITGTGITVANIKAENSIGVGANPSGTAGQLLVNSAIQVGSATGGYVADSINVAGDAYKNNVAISGGGGFSGTYTGNVTFTGDLTVTGQTKTQDLWVTRSVGMTTAPDGTTGHFAGTPLAFTGASINMTGALAVTGNVQAQSLYATASLGVGTSPSGTTGRIDASTLAGITFSSLSVSGALSSGSFSTGSASVSSLSASTIGAHTMTGTLTMGGNNISGVNDIGGSGSVFFTSGTIYGSGGVFTNADVSGTLAKSGTPYNFP